MRREAGWSAGGELMAPRDAFAAKYSADSVRSILRMAAGPAAAAVDLVESIYLAHRAAHPVSRDIDTITPRDLAEVLGRDDDERQALARAFRDGVQDRDMLRRCAELWLEVIGASVKPKGKN